MNLLLFHLFVIFSFVNDVSYSKPLLVNYPIENRHDTRNQYSDYQGCFFTPLNDNIAKWMQWNYNGAIPDIHTLAFELFRDLTDYPIDTSDYNTNLTRNVNDSSSIFALYDALVVIDTFSMDECISYP